MDTLTVVLGVSVVLLLVAPLIFLRGYELLLRYFDLEQKNVYPSILKKAIVRMAISAVLIGALIVTSVYLPEYFQVTRFKWYNLFTIPLFLGVAVLFGAGLMTLLSAGEEGAWIFPVGGLIFWVITSTALLREMFV